MSDVSESSISPAHSLSVWLMKASILKSHSAGNHVTIMTINRFMHHACNSSWDRRFVSPSVCLSSTCFVTKGNELILTIFWHGMKDIDASMFSCYQQNTMLGRPKGHCHGWYCHVYFFEKGTFWPRRNYWLLKFRPTCVLCGNKV